MGIKNKAENAVLVAGTAAAAVFAISKLNGMDADDIRGIGEKIDGVVEFAGDHLGDSELVQSLLERADEYIPGASGALLKAGDTVGHAPGKFFDAMAGMKDRAEQNGTDFTDELADGLKDGLQAAVSTAGEFVKEKTGLDIPSVPGSEPGPDAGREADYGPEYM